MKAWWTVQAARIDALSLRERVFLFVSLLVALLAMADVLWLTPAQAAYKQVQQRLATQTAEVDRLRAELAAVSRSNDPSQAVRDEISQSDVRLEALRKDIAALAPSAAAGSLSLEPVLVQFLQRRPGLRLVSSGTLSADALQGGAPQAPGLVRRGLELKVTGPYGELTRYVKSLEQALPHLRWGAMHLVVDKQVPELTLQVFVLEVQP